MTPEERDQWRQFALNELLLDSGNRAAAATVVILDTIAALQRENAALREALVKARAHTGIHPNTATLDLTLGLLRSIQRIADAALTPSAAPGEADCSICRQPGCTGGHACE